MDNSDNRDVGELGRQMQATKQFKEALARDVNSRPAAPIARPTLVPTDDEMKIMTDHITGQELQDGVSMQLSRDMQMAWVRFAQCIKEARMVKNTREEAVRREVFIIGDVVLPLQQEVTYARDMRVGKILSVSVGYADRPYYRVQFHDEKGEYRVPAPEEHCTQLYARDLVNYGLTPPEDIAKP